MEFEKNSKDYQSSTGSSRWQLLAGSTLLLSLLLVGTVGTLIYVQLHTTPYQARAGAPDVHETVHLVGKDEIPLGDESITFNREDNIAIYQGDDGSFSMQDFNKGLNIMRVQGGRCFVIPADFTSTSSKGLDEFLQQRGGQNVTLTRSKTHFRAIPGMIDDTSFISPRASEFCTEGYQWMVQESEATIESSGHDLVKRAQAAADNNCSNACTDRCTCGRSVCYCGKACEGWCP